MDWHCSIHKRLVRVFLVYYRFFIGLNMLRSSASTIMPQLQQMQMSGQLGNDPAVSKKLATAMAGFY